MSSVGSVEEVVMVASSSFGERICGVVGVIGGMFCCCGWYVMCCCVF